MTTTNVNVVPWRDSHLAGAFNQAGAVLRPDGPPRLPEEEYTMSRNKLMRGALAGTLLLATQAAPAQAGWFCPWAGRGCHVRTQDVACSPGAQQSTVATATVLPNGRAFDGEHPVPCGTGFVLHQFNGVEADDTAWQTAIALNIKVRGATLLTSCQTWWPADNLHGAQTVVCAGGGESVTVTIHPAE